MTFAEVVRTTRALTLQRHAASASGVTLTFWSDVEHGRRLPSPETAERMRLAVGGDPDEWALTLACQRLGQHLYGQVVTAAGRTECRSSVLIPCVS